MQFVRGDGEPGRGAAIVNERFAAMFFPGEDAIGQRIRLADPARPGQAPANPGEWMTVVGVAQNVRQRPGHRHGVRPRGYVPFTSDVVWNMNVLLRTDGDMATAAAALRAQVAAIDPDLPLFDVRTVDDLLTFQNWGQRVFGTMFGVFASLALLMAAVGSLRRHRLWRVAAHARVRRPHGARGAGRARGVAGGAPVIVAGRRGAAPRRAGRRGGVTRHASRRVGLARGRPRVSREWSSPFVIVVAALACLVPARRAIRVDPVVALRND